MKRNTREKLIEDVLDITQDAPVADIMALADYAVTLKTARNPEAAEAHPPKDRP